ncbi:MAG: 4Fe-4S dicluster domain-containing protein [Thermodesulfobacteriota bacterium]|jgi:heterodisulfide reductase subunit C
MPNFFREGIETMEENEMGVKGIKIEGHAAATDPSFLDLVAQEGGENLLACYQCQKCSAGCPVAYAMDILPNQVIRMVQFGLRERVLTSNTIWICASCYTCSVRCPNDIDIAKTMDVLRHIALKSGVKLAERDIPIFHSVFLDSIKSKGRIHELGLIWQYKAKTRDFMKDAALGWKMFRKGKIKLLPSKFGGGKEIRGIFSRYGKGK